MKYTIEVYDTDDVRVDSFDEAPLLEATRTAPDQPDVIHGLLPVDILKLGHDYQVRVLVDGALFCQGRVSWVGPQWGDMRKLILDRYVPFHEVVEFEAVTDPRDLNPAVSGTFINRDVSVIARELVNLVPGILHYLVDHGAYPSGAVREYTKYFARETPDTELEVGGVATGNWVESQRIDSTGAFARDGQTIAGLVVDGVSWPDVVLMGVSADSLSLDDRAMAKHPETAGWTSGRYGNSPYKRRADAARDALQALVAAGVTQIELNAHRGRDGMIDGRIDAAGRYVGMVYGSGQNLNASMIELGLAEVYFNPAGTDDVHGVQLKDFYSLLQPEPFPDGDSVRFTGVNVTQMDVQSGVLEALTALTYLAGGYHFSVDVSGGVRFRRADRADRIYYFDPVRMGIQLGSGSDGLTNELHYVGNPLLGYVDKTYTETASAAEFGTRESDLEFFPLSHESDVDSLAAGILADVAYPETTGWITFFQGEAEIAPGDLIELRDGPLRRLEAILPEEWLGRFTGMLAARVNKITHRFSGRQVSTTAYFTSPFRSVTDPLAYLVRSQASASALFQLRLDEETVGLDMGYHLG